MNSRLLIFALLAVVAMTGRVQADIRMVTVDATKPPTEFSKKYHLSIERKQGRTIIKISYAVQLEAADAPHENVVLEGCWMTLAAKDGTEVLNAPLHFSRGTDGRYSTRLVAADHSVGRLTVAMTESVLQGGRGRTYYNIHFKNLVPGNDKVDRPPGKTSRFRVKLLGIAGAPTRRFSCSVSFEVVEVLHDAYALNPIKEKPERSKPGFPTHGIISAGRILQGSDVQNGKDSMTRLLTFLGAKDVDGYVRHAGPYIVEKKENLLLTVTHAEHSGDVRWELEDQKGRRVTIRPYKSSR